MEFWDGVIHLLFLSGKLPADYISSKSLAFAVGAGFMGSIVIILDWIAYIILERSFFNMNHGGLKSIRFVILWGVASVIGGYLAAVADIFQVTRLGCLAVGILGPLILPKIKQAVKPRETNQGETAEVKE